MHHSRFSETFEEIIKQASAATSQVLDGVPAKLGIISRDQYNVILLRVKELEDRVQLLESRLKTLYESSSHS